MLQRIKKLLEHNALLMAIIVTTAIAILSLTAVPKIDLGIKINSSDKYLHTFAYFVLGFVWLFVFRDKLKKPSFIIYLIIALIIYGIILEILQGGITSYRTADFFDVIANTIGIITATAIFTRFLKWYNSI